MDERRCLICQGSGKVMGGGFQYHDCADCEGVGKLYYKVEEVESKTKQRRKRLEESKL